jgi:ferritin
MDKETPEMLDKKMLAALNDQLQAEYSSAYLYLAMAAYFDANNLPGSAQWMKVQYGEEVAHAMKFYGYIYDRLGAVTLKAIEAPKATWTSPLAAFEAAFKHEQYITGRISALVDQAAKLGDHATERFLDWFVNEQVEEESSVDKVVQQLKMIGDSKGSLLMLDHVLGKRG